MGAGLSENIWVEFYRGKAQYIIIRFISDIKRSIPFLLLKFLSSKSVCSNGHIYQVTAITVHPLKLFVYLKHSNMSITNDMMGISDV